MNVILTKISAKHIVDLDKLILKVIWKGKETWIAIIILIKYKTFGEITLSKFETCYKSIVIKTLWYWWRNKHIRQWNRTECLEIDPHKYGQLIFDKAAKVTEERKDSLFQQMVLEQSDIHRQKKQTLTYISYLIQKLIQNCLYI